MPRKSHRRCRKKIGQALPPAQSREERAMEEQDQLKQESLRRHLNWVLQGGQMPPESYIIERLKQNGKKKV